MIYKLTLLKDLPETDASFTYYLRGGLASHDGEEWFSWITREPAYARLYQLFVEKRTDWVEIEETNLPDTRYELQHSFPNNRLVSFKEALEQQGFLYDESFYGINNIRCCQEQLKMLGATKADCIYCSNCGKAVQDAVNFLVWGLNDVEPPRRAYFAEYSYDPYRKFIIGQVKEEHI